MSVRNLEEQPEWLKGEILQLRDLELEDLKLLDELVCAQLACFLSFFLSFSGSLDGHN